MMQSEGPTPAEDRRLWQRCRTMDAGEDETARFLDLAAYADRLLDVEEEERVAALLSGDPEAAADVRAAEVLTTAERTSVRLDRTIPPPLPISPATNPLTANQSPPPPLP